MAVGHLAVHVTGGNTWLSEMGKKNMSLCPTLASKKTKSIKCPDLRRSPEYFSTATSLGGGGAEGFCPADAVTAGLLFQDGGERRGLDALLLLSTGWKELPTFISTSGPLSSEGGG